MDAFEMVSGEHFMWGDREMVAVTIDADAGTANLVYADTPTGPQVTVAADKLTHVMPPASMFSETVTTVEDMPGGLKVTRCPCGGPILYPRDANGRYRCGTCDARHTYESLGFR